MYPANEVCTKWNFLDSCQMTWFKLRIKLARKKGESIVYSSFKVRTNVKRELEKEGCRAVILESMYESWTWITW